MDEVLDQVAIAFEEDGVNHSVLDELKKVRPHNFLLDVAILSIVISLLFSNINDKRPSRC